MNINYLTLMIVLLSGISILLLVNKSLRKKTVNWLYLFSGGLALYFVETATHEKPFQNTLLLVVVLYLIPVIVDGLLSAGKSIDVDHSMQEHS